jgi:uncharacterized OsmC-like protein
VSTTGVQGGDTRRTWVERQGTGRWVGHNERGGRVEIGPADAPGTFNPGELLRIALAGCVGLTVDAPLERRIGPDGPATVEVTSTVVPDDDRYDRLTTRLVVDLSGFDEDARTRLFTSLHRAVAGHCTVGRTLEAGATAVFTVVGEDGA